LRTFFRCEIRGGDNGWFVEREHLAVAHDRAAADDDRIHVRSFDGVHELGIKAIARSGVGRDGVQQNDVRLLAGLERTYLLFYVKCASAADGSHLKHLFGRKRARVALNDFLQLGGDIHFRE
jgi:hypothetical protein